MMLLPLTAGLQANHDNPSWTWEVVNHRLALVLSLWIGQNTQRRLESEDKRGAYKCICILERLYVPRLQSEELARRAAERLPRDGCAADLCTGVGAIAAYLGQMAPNATVVGTDLNLRAVRCARRNGVQAIVSELGSSLHSGAFDVVSVVAPYVPTGQLRLLPADVQRFEPTLALDGGADGLTQLRRSVFDAQRLLHAGGWFLAEVGGVQDRMLEPVLRSAGFDNFLSWHDEDGDLRGVCAQLI